MHWIKVEPRYVQAQGPPLSTEVSFVRIDPGDCKLPQDNQRVSFQRSQMKVKCPSLKTGLDPLYSKTFETLSLLPPYCMLG